LTYDDLTLQLKSIVLANPVLSRVLNELEDMPELRSYDYYVAAGCITQTVWNALTGREPGCGVKDVDIVYFDPDLGDDRDGLSASGRRGTI
jgi:hypothetical protein